ncbi:MAG: LON peptidase substrate-binding domain-containing protein, partial [Candidatus Babeliales bacterium]
MMKKEQNSLDEAAMILQETSDIDKSAEQKIDTNLYPVLPLKNMVALPKSILPIVVGRPFSVRAVEYALKNELSVFVTAQRDPTNDDPHEKDLYSHGVLASIIQIMRMPNESLKILVEGLSRAKMVSVVEKDGFIGAHCEALSTENVTLTTGCEAAWRLLKSTYLAYMNLHEKNFSPEFLHKVTTAEEMDAATDTIAVQINNLSIEDRQVLLETTDLEARMIMLCKVIAKEKAVLEMEANIRGRIQTQLEKNQQEYYLMEQMKAIQKELGRDDQTSEINTMREQAEALH